MNNRLKVQKVIRSVITDAMTALGYSGWSIQEFASPDFVSLDKAVLMNLVRTERLGWQSNSTYVTGSGPKRKDEWLELEHWQLHIIAKRPKNADENTVVAEDVTAELVAYLNGPGMDAFRRNGIAPERIDGQTVLVYNDDNEIFQKRGVFTVKIQVPKELITGETMLESIKPGIVPV